MSASHAAGGADGRDARLSATRHNAGGLSGLDNLCNNVVEEEVGLASGPSSHDALPAGVRVSVEARHARPQTPLALGDSIGRTLCSPFRASAGLRDSTADAGCSYSVGNFSEVPSFQAVEDPSAPAATSGARHVRPGSRPPTRGDRPAPPPVGLRKLSRPGSRPSTPAVGGISTSASATGQAPPWHRLPPSRRGGAGASRPATAESSGTDWMMDEVSASPPPTAGGSSVMTGLGGIDGWGMGLYDYDEQAVESLPVYGSIYSSMNGRPGWGAAGGQAQVLILDGNVTESPPAIWIAAGSLTLPPAAVPAPQLPASPTGDAAASGWPARAGREIGSSHEMAGSVPIEEGTTYSSFPQAVPIEGDADVGVEGLAQSTHNRVRSVCARLADTEGGTGPWSEPTSLTTTASLRAPLAPPTALRRAARELVLAWLSPEGTAAAPAGELFEVEMAEADAHVTAGPIGSASAAVNATTNSAAGAWSPWRLIYRGSETQCALRDLKPARIFRLRVRLIRMPDGAPAAAAPVGVEPALAAAVQVGGQPAVSSMGPESSFVGELAPRGLDAGGNAGPTEWSEPLLVATEVTVPAAPVLPAVCGRSADAIEVTWVAPEAHGSAILRHELRLQREVSGYGNARSHSAALPVKREPPARASRAIASAGDCGRYTVTVLPAVAVDNTGEGGTRVVARLERDTLPGGSRGRVSARAANALGNGPWSEAVTIEVEPRPPAAPTRLVMQERRARDVRVRWTTPSTNGASLTQAEIGLVLLGGTNQPEGASAPGTSVGLPTGLTPVAGGSMPSCSVDSVPHAPVSHGLLAAAPPLAPPPESSGEWALAWVGESPVEEGASAWATVRGLLPGCAYAIRVRVNNSAGEGAWSAPLLLQTAGGAVPTPLPPSVAAKTSTTMSLRWSPAAGCGARAAGPAEAVLIVAEPVGERGPQTAAVPEQGLTRGERMRWELQMDLGVRVKYNSDGLNAGRGGGDDSGIFSSGGDFSSGMLPAPLRRSAALGPAGGSGLRGRATAGPAAEKANRPHPLHHPHGHRPPPRLPPMQSPLSLSGPTAPAGYPRSPVKRGTRPAGRTETVGLSSRSTSGSVPADSLRTAAPGAVGAATAAGGSATVGDSTGPAAAEAEEVEEVPEELSNDSYAHMNIPVEGPSGDAGGSSAPGLWPGGSPWPPSGIGSPGVAVSALEESFPLEVHEEELDGDASLPPVVGEVEEAGSLVRALDCRDLDNIYGGGGGGSHYDELLMGGGMRRPTGSIRQDAERELRGRAEEPPEFRTVYAGEALEHTVVALTPACRCECRRMRERD